jgi:methionine-S-sulfoxide reductase
LNNKAYLAGGCFWCTESIFQRVIGVKNVSPGYMGGSIKNPAYREVCVGNTGHTEAIEVIFDSFKIGRKTVMKVFAIKAAAQRPSSERKEEAKGLPKIATGFVPAESLES